MIQYIKNEQHYELLLEQISKIKHTLWIGTADLKDLYVKKQNNAIPFLVFSNRKSRKEYRYAYFMPKNRVKISAMTSTNTLPYGKGWKEPYALVSILKSWFSICKLFISVPLI